MKAIIIGAGRGRRLMPLTEELPKCLAPVAGRPILDWILEALAAGGFARNDVVFVGGYQLPRVRAACPDLTYYENERWQHNNILASLFYAEPAMADGFVCTYADILYRPQVVERLLRGRADATLVIDTDWRRRYQRRSKHPETDAEKVRAEADRITSISRLIPAQEAAGEYIGVAKFTARGAEVLREHYRRVSREYDGRAFQGAPSVEMAYLIHLLQEMLEHQVDIYKVDTHGDYYEIDTREDYEIAVEEWR